METRKSEIIEREWGKHVRPVSKSNFLSWKKRSMEEGITHLINLLSLSVNANIPIFCQQAGIRSARRIFDTLPFE